MIVLDVDSRRRVSKPDKCEYIALSYVWGTQAAVSESFSKVVEDSFVVTKKLGYKYLWVDRYCINQNDDTNKHEQIRAMHLIYGNAVLTLIAAAGKNSDYGLPGVGSRERAEQNSLSIGNKLYIRTFPHASQTFKASKWATRGWTFQEGLLSKRRLIFTDY
ncbi:hypothetical protein N8I77_000072 [Diaporthe amygdali]|uniref:Heterokaryon incompatibility domain-containing protein n=1 Tax=Phomopsis amygdali TaxID=1214568 RepID=A0AAD9SQ57_PHOAM|nr:hypothetical protein N8I77_000072 [Diaporthe amygdali]